jgi:oligopeptidase B
VRTISFEPTDTPTVRTISFEPTDTPADETRAIVPSSSQSNPREVVAWFPRGAAIRIGVNPDFDAPFVRVAYTSMHVPLRVYDVALRDGSMKLVDSIEGPPELADYICDVVAVPAQANEHGSGALIPVTLFHHRNIRRDHSNAVFLKVYGAYGARLENEFLHEYLALARRGVVVALAHVRGGGELIDWHEQAQRARKSLSAHDLLAVARGLITAGYTQSGLLMGHASSAGCLALGLAVAMSPSLWASCVLRVGFMNPLAAMRDDTLPLTVAEYSEWGNPADRVEAQAMAQFDPYMALTALDQLAYATNMQLEFADSKRRRVLNEQEREPKHKRRAHANANANANASAQEATRLPAMLLTASMLDTRVPYWHPLKFIARLRAMLSARNAAPTQHSAYQLRVHTNVGHFGEGGQYSQYADSAHEINFLLSHLPRTRDAERNVNDTDDEMR